MPGNTLLSISHQRIGFTPEFLHSKFLCCVGDYTTRDYSRCCMLYPYPLWMCMAASNHGGNSRLWCSTAPVMVLTPFICNNDYWMSSGFAIVFLQSTISPKINQLSVSSPTQTAEVSYKTSVKSVHLRYKRKCMIDTHSSTFAASTRRKSTYCNYCLQPLQEFESQVLQKHGGVACCSSGYMGRPQSMASLTDGLVESAPHHISVK